MNRLKNMTVAQLEAELYGARDDVATMERLIARTVAERTRKGREAILDDMRLTVSEIEDALAEARARRRRTDRAVALINELTENLR